MNEIVIKKSMMIAKERHRNNECQLEKICLFHDDDFHSLFKMISKTACHQTKI